MSTQDRLRWRCRRGTRELDVLLMRYLECDHAEASPTEQVAFGQLLECPDPQLQDIFLGGRKAPNPAMEAIAEKIRRGMNEHA